MVCISLGSTASKLEVSLNPFLKTCLNKCLFLYFKLYRANIRLKVNALRAEQAVTAQEKDKFIGLVEDYYHLYRRYLNLLTEREGKQTFQEEFATKG